MTTAKTTFSVVVNTTDRANSLQTLLRALEHQSYPHFEVLVVVGPTRDNTLSILEQYAGRVRVLHCAAANLGISRNIGLAAARGDIVAYIDDDAVPCRNWLNQFADLFQDAELDATGGAVFLVDPVRTALQFRLGLFSSLGEATDVRSDWLDGLVAERLARFTAPRMMGTNMAFRRQALLDVGGFDEYYEWVYDESDLCLRLVTAGKTVHPVHEAVVYHIPASSRNRQLTKSTARWWIQTKAALYFTLQHGRNAREHWRAIGLRCLYLMHGRWIWGYNYHKAGNISLARLLRMWAEEVRAWAIAIPAGIFTQPRLMQQRAPTGGEQGPAQAAASAIEPAAILPFPVAMPSTTPSVDPVAGRAPQITLPEPPLRICLLSAGYPPKQYEGVGRHTHLMAQGLFELGHNVHVIAEGVREQVTYYDGAYVHRIPCPTTRYRQYALLPKVHHLLNYSHAVNESVRRLELNDGIQLVDSPVWGIDGLVTAIEGRLPVVVRPQTALRQVSELQQNVHDDFRLVGELEQSLVTAAAYLVPNSQATVKALSEVYSMQPGASYMVVPHGVVPVQDEAVRPFPLSDPPAVLTVLYVGRLEKRKGVLDLFTAIPQVLAAVTNVRFVLAGADNSIADGFQARMGVDYPTHYARRNPQTMDRVRFLGAVPEDELQRLYQSCDLFVAPSLYESFGLIYLEAMNYAKPVVGCRGGVPEVVDDKVTGLLTDPGAPEQLASALIGLLRSPAQLYTLGLAGRKRLLERFTYLHMARGFVQVYRTVLARQAVRSGASQ